MKAQITIDAKQVLEIVKNVIQKANPQITLGEISEFYEGSYGEQYLAGVKIAFELVDIDA